MKTYKIEITDTFHGEANYSWVTRHEIKAKSMLGAVQKLSRMSGLNWHKVDEYDDMCRYDSKSGATCAFVENSGEEYIMLTTIPFSGFYYSLHDSALDSALESIFSNDSGNKRDSMFYAAQDATDWRMVKNNYAAEYAAAFSAEFNLTLQFESMKSPREYNSSTDTIYCTISEKNAALLFDTCDKALLDKIARETFTSRDGFASFYNPDFTEWGGVLAWDSNQLGTLIRAHVAEQNPDFDQWAEFELMESAQCNGKLDNWILKSNPENLNRLANINSYLNTREGR